MGIIRGKIEADREIRPRQITVGDPPFYEVNGKWFDSKTHEKIEVEITTLGELMDEWENDHE